MAFPAVKVLDSFKRTESPLSNGGKWTTINGFSGTGVCEGGNAWFGGGEGGVETWGGFWNVEEFKEPAVGAFTFHQAGNNSTVELFACLTNPTTAEKSGYRLLLTQGEIASQSQTLAIQRMVKGAFTTLESVALKGSTKTAVEAGDGIALQVTNGKVIAWHKKGEAAWVEVISAEDSTFTKGNIGIGETNPFHVSGFGLTNFEVGGQTFTKQLTPSLTPAGKVTELKTVVQKLTASVTPAASLSKSFAFVRSFSASLTPEGTLRKVFALVRSFQATLEPEGQLRQKKLLRNRTIPAITGPAIQGIAEVEVAGTWEAGSIVTTLYQWFRSGVAIEGATGKEYVPTVADIGHTLTVTETVTDELVTTATAESLPTPVITVGVPTNEAPPSITGPAREGEVELEIHGVWDVPVEEFLYEWFRCDALGGSQTSIEGAHRKTYVPVPADVGHTLRVSEVVVNSAGHSVPAFSTQTPVIEATAATSQGLAPTQPDVPEPVLKWPFRMAADESHIDFIEQDTPQEYEQCVALTLITRPGEFPDESDFGLPDPTFTEGGVSEADLVAVVRRWEPRAHLFFTQDELIGFAQEVGIKVKS